VRALSETEWEAGNDSAREGSCETPLMLPMLQLTDQQCHQGNELNRALIDVKLLVAEHILASPDLIVHGVELATIYSRQIHIFVHLDLDVHDNAERQR
jgi:hypothetical protein